MHFITTQSLQSLKLETNNEVFSIIKVNNTNTRTYLLNDEKGEEIRGAYTEELQKTAHPEVFLIERVIKKKGNELYVKFLNLKNYSWIYSYKNDLV
ncbi:hypothetical protein NQ315_006082 [Exocentrus adspersus]|uniref:Uncharacterized protein n=1 Tax=Exocentrus adspersus TaxID=1586481 RepID=A0AAV8VG72_9CUCU|nr:hypothetical protein NQ315_006082 [Exocentrus adspersus]